MPANVYLESLLETDARIIAENDTHAVLAIRVDKAAMWKFIRRNTHIVSAMTNLTPPIEAKKSRDKL